MAEQKIQMIPTAELDFDPDNPRFYRLKNAHDIQAVIEKMLDVENLPDLMNISETNLLPESMIVAFLTR